MASAINSPGDSNVRSIAPEILLLNGRHDTGNSQRFVYLKRGDFYYSYALKKWLRWDGKRYVIDDGRFIEAAAKEVALMYAGVALKSNDSDARKHSVVSLDSRRIEAMVKLSRTDLAINENDLDRNPWLLNTPTCTVDLQTGKTYAHRRDDLITKITGFGYDPEAECPLWRDALSQWVGSARMAKYLQRALGYSATGLTREKALFFCYGVGDNGKTTMLHTVVEALGDYAALVMVESLMQRNPGATEMADLADLRGVRFALTSETEDGQRFAEGRIKRLSQGVGKIRACKKYENPITFDATAKIWIDGNYKPEIRGGDPAIRNRFRLLHFPSTLSGNQKDRSFSEKLLKEGEGILAWLVAGCLTWQRDGLAEPLQVRKDTDAWDREADALTGFFEDCCRFEKDAHAGERELWESFVRWCEKQKVQTTVKRTALKARLAALNCKETRAKVGRGHSERAWKGVCLASR